MRRWAATLLTRTDHYGDLGVRDKMIGQFMEITVRLLISIYWELVKTTTQVPSDNPLIERAQSWIKTNKVDWN